MMGFGFHPHLTLTFSKQRESFFKITSTFFYNKKGSTNALPFFKPYVIGNYSP